MAADATGKKPSFGVFKLDKNQPVGGHLMQNVSVHDLYISANGSLIVLTGCTDS